MAPRKLFFSPRRRAAQAMLQTAMECLEKSLEECLTCLKLPGESPAAGADDELLERLIEAARRRTKLIGTIPGETAGLSLVYAVLVDVSELWRGLRIAPGDLEKLAALKTEVAPMALSA